MAFFPRLLLQLGLALTAPALLAWIVASAFLPITPEQQALLRLATPLGALALDGVSLLGLWRLSAPLREALAAKVPGTRLANHAALVAHRLPSRLAAMLLVLSGAVVAGLGLVMRRAGVPGDLALAALAMSAAAAILAAMIAYALTATEVAHALAELGPGVVFREKGTLRGKVLSVGYGLLTSAVLLFFATGYVSFRREGEADWLEQAERVQASAVAATGGAPGSVEFVWRATGASTAFLDGEGRVLARAGPDLGALLQDPGAPGAQRVAGGWLVRRELSRAGRLVSFLPDGPLEARWAAYWRSALGLGLVVYAFAALLVWLAARTLSVPVRALGRAAGRIAAGDLTAGPPSLSRDEMGRLAAEFRRMTQGLVALVGEVREAAQGVNQAARDLGEIGERVQRGALEQHRGVGAVDEASQAMQGSIGLVGNGIEGLSDYVASTSSAVGEMATALEEVGRQGKDLERAMADAMKEVDGLSEAGQRAGSALRTLDALANRTGETLAGLSTSLSGLELAAVASQLNAAQAEELAEHAGEVVAETVKGIESVRATVGDAQRRVTALGRRAGDIDQIVDFIAGVAGRTNLLSLNASIIAAQAGEHGKAFGVVADQIRELAAQIASSTKSIGDIIRAVRDDVEGTAALIGKGDALAAAGVRLAQNSVQALGQIRSATAQGHQNAASIQGAVQTHVQSTRQVSDVVSSVVEGSRAVSQAVERIGGSVAALGAVQHGVGTMADRIAGALGEQSSLGRRQLQSLERIDARIAEIRRAVADHGVATRSVHESVADLERAAEQHEAAVAELGAVAERLGAHARAVSERVDRFRVA